MNIQTTALLTLLLIVAAFTPASADVRLHGLFGDNMVLQQGKPLPVWGTAEAGEAVTVTVGAETLTANADDAGRWVVRLQPIKQYGPVAFTVAGKNTLTLNNVVVGEVWVCSGQSNMAWKVWASGDARNEVAAANHPELRLYTVPARREAALQSDVAGQWRPATPTSTGNFSAVAYYFGRELNRNLKVPIGLINASVGGTAAELWTPADALKDNPKLVSPTTTDPTKTSFLYNGMIAPLQPFAMQGVIWYQGETNIARGAFYKELFPALIRGWRTAWGQGDFPFFFVQLANYGKRTETPSDAPRARLREAQFTTLSVPGTAMAVAIDIGEGDNIHPKNKQEVGRRLSLPALALVYGQKLVYSGPLFTEASFENGAARIKFKHADGLKATGDGVLKGFAIAGEDRKWVWGNATIDKETIVVSSPEVPVPVAVRYAWGDDPEGNLVNEAGLPASPFRTDDWGVGRK